MCAGAIINSRIKKIYIGALDEKTGAAGSVLNLFEDYKFNHKVEVEKGILKEECENILKSFFKELRKIKKDKIIYGGIMNIRTNRKIFHICLLIVVITALFFVTGVVILRYHVEGEKDLPFKISSIKIISSVEGIDQKDEQNKWNIEY